MREEGSILSSGCRFSAEMMDLMTIRHSNNDVLDDAKENRKRCEKKKRAVRALKQGLGNPPSAGQVPKNHSFEFVNSAV